MYKCLRITRFFKFFSLLFIHGLFTQFLFGQQLANVSLQVLDETDQSSLLAAAVSLYTQSDSQFVSGVLSGEEGRCSLIGIPKGSYFIVVSYVGYEEKKLPVLIGGLNLYFDMGKVALTPVELKIEGIEIEGKKSTVDVSMDKKSFDMDDNLSQAGGSVLDAIRNLPGVTVDADSKVLLRGSDQVAILIDGKQSSLTGFATQSSLDNIPASRIARIEIINNPSAKYDASGMAGIINLVYKEETRSGIHGEVGLSYGLGELTTRKTDLPTELGRFSVNPKYIPSLSLNYGNDKLRAFFQTEILHQKKLPNNEFNTRSYNDGKKIISQVPENRTQTQYILKGGLDWLMDEKNTLSLSAIFDYESHLDTAQVPYIDLNTNQRNRFWHWSEEEVTGFLNYRLDYKHKFPQPGHSLDFGVQYTRGWEDEEYTLRDSSEFRVGADTTHIIAIEHTGQFLVNYVKPLKSGRLEAGSKLQLRRIPVTYEVGRGVGTIIYENLGDWSKWGEDIYAAYLNYVWEKPLYDIEGGIRAEQTQVFYTLAEENTYYNQNDSYDYFQVYPNLRFTLKLDERNGLSAFYNRRVDRPGEPELRVFPKYDDPELMKVGNPFLRPQFTQTVELAYRRSWSKGNVFIAGYHRWIDDPFTRVYSIDTSSISYNIVNRIYQNVGRGTHAGVEVLFSQELSKDWKLSGSLNVYSNVIYAYTGELLFPYIRPFEIPKTESNTWDFKINNEIILREDIQVQLTALYYAPKNIPQGRQLSRSSVDIGVKKTIFSGKGELNFSFTDMFNQFGIRQEIEESSVRVLYENYYETQVVRIGAKYKF